jgi:nitrate reductase gamma subunit
MPLLTSPGAIANAVIALLALITLLVRLSRAWQQPLSAEAESRNYFINFVLAAIAVAGLLGLRVFLVGEPQSYVQALSHIAV